MFGIGKVIRLCPARSMSVGVLRQIIQIIQFSEMTSHRLRAHFAGVLSHARAHANALDVANVPSRLAAYDVVSYGVFWMTIMTL